MSRASIAGLTIALTVLAGSLRPTTADDAGRVRRLAVLQLHDAAGYSSVVTVAVGQTASIARSGVPTLLLSPQASGEGLLRLRASLVWAGETVLPVETAQDTPLSLGGTARVDLGPYLLDVIWLEDRAVAGATSADDGVHECCVVCEGITTCACRVQAPCGSCCDQQCGGCAENGTPQPTATRSLLQGREHFAVNNVGAWIWRVLELDVRPPVVSPPAQMVAKGLGG